MAAFFKLTAMLIFRPHAYFFRGFSRNTVIIMKLPREENRASHSLRLLEARRL